MVRQGAQIGFPPRRRRCAAAAACRCHNGSPIASHRRCWMHCDAVRDTSSPRSRSWPAEQTCWRGRQRIKRPSGCWFRDYDASAEQHQQRCDATCRLPHPAGGGGGGGTPTPPNQAHGGGPVQQSRWEWPVYHASSLLRHVACEGMTRFNCPTCRRGRHERSRAARAAAGRRCAGGWSSSGPAAGLRHRAGIQEGAGRQMGCVRPLFVLKAAMPARLPPAAHAQRVRVRSAQHPRL